MLNFKPISLDDREKIEMYFKYLEEPFCDFTFGNLFFWSVVENTEITFFNNFLFIRFSDEEYFYYAFPIGDGEIKSALNLIFENPKTNNKKIKFVCLNKNQTKILKENFDDRIKINKNRDAFDYIYSVEKLANLSGRKYHSKKNHFNSFKNKYNFNFEIVNEENINDCILFAQKWYEENEATSTLVREQRALECAFQNYFKLNLIGAIIKVDEKIIAFCIGEKMYNKNIFCTHFEKADYNFSGAYAAINKLFSEFLINDFKLVNREDDAGIDGLRKAKLSYYPEILLEKYYAEFNI